MLTFIGRKEGEEKTLLKEKFELHKRIASKIIRDIRDWRELTIFTYPKIVNLGSTINPEFLALSIAHEVWRKFKINSIVMINTTYMELETALELINEMESPPSTFKFGVDNENFELVPKIKINFEDLKVHGRFLGKIIKSIAPERRSEVNEKLFEEVNNLNDLCNLVIKILEPPSINEIVAGKFLENANKDKIATIARLAGFISNLVLSPISIAPQSIKAVQEIVKTIKSSKEDLYDEWRKALKQSFKAEILEQMFAPKGAKLLVDKIHDNGWTVIFNITDETIYEPFSFYMMWDALSCMIKELNKNKILGVIPDSDSLIQVPAAGFVIRKVIEIGGNTYLTYMFRGKLCKYPKYTKLIKRYIKDKVVIFDMPSNLFNKIFNKDGIIASATLMRCLSKIAKLRKIGDIAYTFRKYGYRGIWKIDKIPLNNNLSSHINRLLMKFSEIIPIHSI